MLNEQQGTDDKLLQQLKAIQSGQAAAQSESPTMEGEETPQNNDALSAEMFKHLTAPKTPAQVRDIMELMVAYRQTRPMIHDAEGNILTEIPGIWAAHELAKSEGVEIAMVFEERTDLKTYMQKAIFVIDQHRSFEVKQTIGEKHQKAIAFLREEDAHNDPADNSPEDDQRCEGGRIGTSNSMIAELFGFKSEALNKNKRPSEAGGTWVMRERNKMVASGEIKMITHLRDRKGDLNKWRTPKESKAKEPDALKAEAKKAAEAQAKAETQAKADIAAQIAEDAAKEAAEIAAHENNESGKGEIAKSGSETVADLIANIDALYDEARGLTDAQKVFAFTTKIVQIAKRLPAKTIAEDAANISKSFASTIKGKA